MNNYIFVYGVEMYKFKAKDSGISAASVNNRRVTELCRHYLWFFNCDSIDADNFLSICRYLMEKHNIKCLNLWKKYLLDY